MTSRAIIDASPVGLAVLRAPALTVELANAAWLDLVGVDGDPAGRPLAEAHPSLAPLLAARLAEVARTGAPIDEDDVPLLRQGDAAERRVTFRLRALPPEPGRGRAVLVVAEDTTGAAVTRARAEALAAMAEGMGAGRPLEDVLERAAARARAGLRADAVFVLLEDAESRHFVGSVEVAGGARVRVAAHAAELPAGARALERGEPVVFRREAAGGLEAAWLGVAGGAYGLCAPLLAARHPRGLLYVTWGAGSPGAAALELAANLASAAELAAESTRILRREREARLASHRATERLELLAESGALLTGAVDWAAVVRTTAQLGLGYLGDVVALDLVGEDGILRREALERAGDPPATPLPASEVGREVTSPAIRDVLAHRRTRRILLPLGGAPMSDDPEVAKLDALGATSCIAAPLVIRGRAAGVLTLVRLVPSPTHDPEDVALATEIARRAALALDDARLLAAASDQAAARDAFLAAAAHDLRSPITALRLQVQALERVAARSGDARNHLARMEGSVVRLARRVDEVLEAARGVPGGLRLEREPLDLAEVAREVAARVVQERRGRAPLVHVVARAPVPGRWDRARVEAIVANLLGVGAKRGGSELELRVTAELRGGRIEVLRTGAEIRGVAPHGETAAAHEELEVGVWIARRFAEAHGGQLRVAKLPNLGARFVVELPG